MRRYWAGRDKSPFGAFQAPARAFPAINGFCRAIQPKHIKTSRRIMCMKINEVKPNTNATLDEVEIASKGEVREFMKFDKPRRVCNCIIKDDSGEMELALWNEEIDSLQVGDKVKITDGWAKEWNGKVQISAGRNGKLEKL